VWLGGARSVVVWLLAPALVVVMCGVPVWLCLLICVYGVFVLGHLSPFFFCLIQRYTILMCVREKIYIFRFFSTEFFEDSIYSIQCSESVTTQM
jgi:hypothetical protein